jgi:hypothetical protein
VAPPTPQPPRPEGSASGPVASAALLGTVVSLGFALGFGGLTFLLPALLGAITLVAFSVTVLRGFRGDPHVPVDDGLDPADLAPVPEPDPADGWAAAQRRFRHLQTEYAAYECDPLQVLRLPALADAAVASTARFVDAFAEAQGLHTDRCPGAAHGDRYVAAVALAESTWQAAQDAAERIRLSGFTPAERATVERIIKLLTTARDSDNEPERLAAYSLARSELTKLERAGVVRVPRLAMAALDEGARRALPR